MFKYMLSAVVKFPFKVELKFDEGLQNCSVTEFTSWHRLSQSRVGMWFVVLKNYTSLILRELCKPRLFTGKYLVEMILFSEFSDCGIS